MADVGISVSLNNKWGKTHQSRILMRGIGKWGIGLGDQPSGWCSIGGGNIVSRRAYGSKQQEVKIDRK